MALDQRDWAEPARGIDLRSLLVDDIADALAAGGKDTLTALHGLYHRHAVGDVVRHGFFAVDIFAGAHGID